ncbi:MAG: type II and III secretion system protein [Planctomycetes bacterium]|nr:type II and III secretion system protein [Planctomycetota bacterium]MCB9903682.1 type II and III secretion system protein [Planctomycetota bacterium]
MRSLPVALSPLLSVALCLTQAGCRSNEPEAPAPRGIDQEPLSMEEFRRLIQDAGTMSPVDEAMGDPYRDVDPEMGSTPEELAAARAAEEAQEQELPAIPVVQNPYQEFGSRIQVHDDTGLITKPYPMRPGMGQKMVDLITEYGDFTIYDSATGPQGPATVRLDLRAGFDQEFISNNLRSSSPDAGQGITLSDWLIVTASQALLSDVEFFIDIFAGGPPQIEIEAKIVEWVTNDSLDLGVGPVNDSTPIVDFPGSTLVRDLTWNFPNQVGANQFLATVGTVQDGVTYNMVLEALSKYENVSIISRPKVAVREGGKANIEAIEKIPYLKITSITNSGGFNTALDYQEVGVRLFVVPRLVGTGTVSLEISVEASLQTASTVAASTAAGDQISLPTLASRKAETLVYLKPGQAVILGGLITERNVEDEKKIPLLGDIPLLGYLFKSRFTSTEKAQVLFFIRPRVLGGSDLNRDF